MRGGRRSPFRAGPLTNPEFFRLELKDFAEMAYAFMTGVHGWGQYGFCMMDPEVLKKQRWTFVKYWYKKLASDRQAVNQALKG